MNSKPSLVCLIAALCFVSGCNYDFPLTAKPTRKVESRLLGNWVAVDKGKDNKNEELMYVREFDDSTYAVSMDDDIFRVFHSDFANTPFLSVQDLNAGNRKYLYYTWELSADGTQLSLKGISDKVVPDATASRAEIERLIKSNLTESKLFNDAVRYTRKKTTSQ